MTMFARVAGAAALALVAGSALANPFPPGYTFQLQARSAASAAQGTFNLPVLSASPASIGTGNPQINDNRQVAFAVGGANTRINFGEVESAPGVWFGSNAVGGLAFTSTFFGDSLDSTVSMNRFGRVAFAYTTNGRAGLTGVNVIAPAAAVPEARINTAGPGSSSGWSPRINDNNAVATRPSFPGGGRRLQSYTAGLVGPTNHVGNVIVDATSPYVEFFGHAYGNSGAIATFARLGPAGTAGTAARPDQLRLFAADGSSVLLAEDRDSNPASSILSFSNSSLGISDDGTKVAFVAQVSVGASNINRLFLYDVTAGTLTALVDTAIGSRVNSFDAFGVAVNNHGQVAFRGVDRNNGNRPTVFTANASNLLALVSTNSTLSTDRGDRSPTAFSGGLDINNFGDIAFTASLSASAGTGVFVANAIPAPGVAGLLAGLGVLAARRRR